MPMLSSSLARPKTFSRAISPPHRTKKQSERCRGTSEKSKPGEAGKGILRTVVRSAAMALLGFAATAIPLHLLLRRELRDAPEDVRAQGWPIRLMQVLFAKFIVQWINVEGLENLPKGSYLVAANHAYKSGVDGFILGHLLATHARRVPRILMTAENRTRVVRAERWVLHHYGSRCWFPMKRWRCVEKQDCRTSSRHTFGKAPKHAVLIFPAGRAVADPSLQLKDWSTGAVDCRREKRLSRGSGSHRRTAAGLDAGNRDFAAIESDGPPPFRI